MYGLISISCSSLAAFYVTVIANISPTYAIPSGFANSFYSTLDTRDSNVSFWSNPVPGVYDYYTYDTLLQSASAREVNETLISTISLYIETISSGDKTYLPGVGQIGAPITSTGNEAGVGINLWTLVSDETEFNNWVNAAKTDIYNSEHSLAASVQNQLNTANVIEICVVPISNSYQKYSASILCQMGWNKKNFIDSQDDIKSKLNACYKLFN